MLKDRLDSLVAQIIILGLLLLSAPYAMSFTPYERIATDGVWNAPIRLDPMYSIRAGLIIGGLVCALSSFSLLLYTIIKRCGSDLILRASLTLCSIYIGWAVFPYWVNGMFQAYSGNAPVDDFDPKALIPMIWIGEIWRLGALTVLFGAFWLGIVLLIFNTGNLIKYKDIWRRVAVYICLAIIGIIMILSPHHGRWLID